MLSYSLIAAAIVKGTDGKMHKILKLRNPDGDVEWEGAWADEDPLWSEEAKKQVNLVIASDGIFWMALEDFRKMYVSIHVCKYENHHNFTNFAKVETDNFDGYHIFNVTLSESGTHIFSVS